MDEQIQTKTNGMAIAAMVLGIVGVIGSWLVFPLVCAILALIFGIISLNKIRHSGEKGKGMAITGIVLGGIGIILIPVIIAIGALAYFGVLNPQTALPDMCSAGGGFSCNSFSFVDGTLTYTLQNNLGVEATNVMVTSRSNDLRCKDTKNIASVQNGDTIQISFSCPYPKFTGIIAVDYTNPNTGQQQALGTLRAKAK